MDSYFDHSSPLGYAGGVFPLSRADTVSMQQEYLLSDNGALFAVNSASGHGTTSSPISALATAPAPTLVTSTSSNLQIDLVWDSSVASAPTAFQSAVVAATQAYVNDFSSPTKTVLYIAVGWGEVGGTSMAANALGESESSGYLISFSTVANALVRAGDTLNAANEPISSQFFVTRAEAKTLGLVSSTGGSSTSVDGYIGFSTLSGTGFSWNLNATGTTASQFNLQAVAKHEMSEVMGRIGLEGTSIYNGQKTYSPLDLFNFSAPGALSLSASGGYFSNNNGQAHMGNFNNSIKLGGDIADWASNSSVTQSGTVGSGADAFDAFDHPGYDGVISSDDLLEMATLGYKLTPSGAKLT